MVADVARGRSAVSELRCSFCGIAHRDIPGWALIAGPAVYICSDCVQLCAEIVEERRGTAGTVKQAGGAVDLEYARRVSTLELAIKAIAREVVQVMPGPHSIRCMWCDRQLEGEGEAREHVETCERHPAVVELRKLKGRDA